MRIPRKCHSQKILLPEGVKRLVRIDLAELFDESGENVAPQASVELLVAPTNPGDVAMITDELFWYARTHLSEYTASL